MDTVTTEQRVEVEGSLQSDVIVAKPIEIEDSQASRTAVKVATIEEFTILANLSVRGPWIALRRIGSPLGLVKLNEVSQTWSQSSFHRIQTRRDLVFDRT